MPLDLLFPALPRGGPHPQLERWLARADIVADPAMGMHAWLAKRFGLAEVPVAPVTLAADAAPAEGLWLRADPVYASIERDTMVLHCAEVLVIEAEEAREVVASLQAHFAPDGIELAAPRPDRWYARVPEGELPETTPLAEALGADVFRRLPKGSGRINWPSAFTEIQMLLAEHPVNLARQRASKPPINSLWFWGGGRLPAIAGAPYARVHADEPFARGLALLAKVEVRSAPRALADIDAAPTRDVLAVIDPLDAALEDIGDAISRFGAVRIVIPRARDTLVATLTRAARWRWLRQRKPLSAYA